MARSLAGLDGLQPRRVLLAGTGLSLQKAGRTSSLYFGDIQNKFSPLGHNFLSANRRNDFFFFFDVGAQMRATPLKPLGICLFLTLH